MQRFLNLNPLAGRMIAVGAFFLVGVPALLAVTGRLVPGLNLRALILASAALGGVIWVVLLVLIVVEQVQDALLVRSYEGQRSKKFPAGNGLYECQFCGNRQVKEEDTSCGVCGKAFTG